MSAKKATGMLDEIVEIIDGTRDFVMGIDCSTQSLTISIYDTLELNEHHSININFDNEFAKKYKVKNGVIKNGLEVTAPTLMFIEALDIALQRLQKEQNVKFANIVSISGSGQQHGSVYWNNCKSLNNLNKNQSLFDNLKNSFAVNNGPIWMDSSTTNECRQLEFKVGSPLKVALISGSRAYERFTGNQIAKKCKNDHELYSEKVERISLISSFMCSIFLGKYAPIDCSDGSGMNLLDIKTKKWSNVLLASTAPGLKQKLGDTVADSYQTLGPIASYFVDRYGFNPKCDIVAFSGDNPCSLAGLMCCDEGDICISLGTSDTLFAITKTPNPANEGHVLCSPIHEKAFMILLCYKNGSISRENIKEKCGCKTWEEFNNLLFKQSNAGNNGKIAFYYDEAEILPTCEAGIYRYNGGNEMVEKYENKSDDVRAIIESQFMAMRQHMELFGVNKFNNILATGGASQNRAILQVMADVFGSNVYIEEAGPDTATKGAALRALHAYICKQKQRFVPFKQVIDQIGGARYIKSAEPNLQNTDIYNKMLPRRKILESKLPRLQTDDQKQDL